MSENTKSFADGDVVEVTWIPKKVSIGIGAPAGTGEYVLRITSNGHEIYNKSSLDGMNNPGTVSINDVHLFESPNKDQRWVAIQELGTHNDLWWLVHLSSTGKNQWKYDDDHIENLKHYGCGSKGMRQSIRFKDNVVFVNFGVGKNFHFNGGACYAQAIWNGSQIETSQHHGKPVGVIFG